VTPDRPVREDDGRDAVLDAARLAFRASGYVGTTLRGVAAAAGVAPDVVKSYYDNKDALFAAALRLPLDPASAIPELLAPGLDGMGERLVRMTMRTLGDERVRDDLATLFAAAPNAAVPEGTNRAIATLSDFIASSLIDRVVRALGVPDARMRSAVVASHLVGMAVTRYVVRLEPLASAPDELVVRLYAPTIQQLLDTKRPLPTAVIDEPKGSA